MTAVTLTAYSLGMIGFSWQEILNKFFYSAHDSKTPMMAAVVTISLNILLSYILISRIGVAGIGYSSALSVTVMALYLFILAPKKTGFHMRKETWLDIGKGTGAAVVSGALMLFVYTFMPVPSDGFTTFLRLFFVFACGAISYLLMLAFLRVQKLQQLYQILFKGGKAV
ncbi:hypothetical protein SDC9_180060 [bioreactor metagenome]|uniref:Lipid II flippase MurJ n=1 Tax=bioreactor metagenome TaxID=1076179 RepID=A0A645H1P3_9ZZZZ